MGCVPRRLAVMGDRLAALLGKDKNRKLQTRDVPRCSLLVSISIRQQNANPEFYPTTQ
jgi:hypothetical protein